MSRNDEVHGEDESRPPSAKTRWQLLAETIAECARVFHGRLDTFSFTVISAIALIACGFGHAGIASLIFAFIFMVIIPILRVLKLIDQWNDGYPQPLEKRLGKW
jgi:hypothetical protein